MADMSKEQFKIIKADTIEEFKRELSLWLSDQAITNSVASRLCSRKGPMKEELAKADAYRFVAQFVGRIEVEPRTIMEQARADIQPDGKE